VRPVDAQGEIPAGRETPLALAELAANVAESIRLGAE
jgi:hypothetical protein